MRLLACTLLAILCQNLAICQEGWINQTPSNPLPGLKAVYALTSNNIWAAGDDGIIIHSIDGGENWSTVPSGVTQNLYTVEFIDSDIGWVAGDDNSTSSTVLRTTNSGAEWVLQTLSGGGALTIYDVDFILDSNDDPICGYLTGDLGYTWKTENVGDTWEPVRNNCENTFWSSCFVNSAKGWFVGTPSVAEPYTIMNTSDGGDTFQQQTNPTGTNLRGVSFATDQKGVAVGINGTIIYTSNGGATWNSATNTGFKRWQSVFLRESGKAWAVGAQGSIAYSTDFGQTWEFQESGVPTLELMEVYFINDDVGWIVGGGMGNPGVILHTTNGGNITTDIKDNYLVLSNICNLKQNFPNPFSGSTQIEYALFQPGYITISVYDNLGREVEKLVNEFQSIGQYSVRFTAGGISKGIYSYQLKVGDMLLGSKKMVLVE